MKLALTALIAHLEDLKSQGVERIWYSDESLAALRQSVRDRLRPAAGAATSYTAWAQLAQVQGKTITATQPGKQFYFVSCFPSEGRALAEKLMGSIQETSWDLWSLIPWEDTPENALGYLPLIYKTCAELGGKYLLFTDPQSFSLFGGEKPRTVHAFQ